MDHNLRRCDCENTKCQRDHQAGNCLETATVQATFGSLCAPCAAYMPAEFKMETTISEYVGEIERAKADAAVDHVAAANANLMKAAIAFRLAAQNLQTAWDQVAEDGNHPLVECDRYPFEESFDEISNDITEWVDAAERIDITGFDYKRRETRRPNT